MGDRIAGQTKAKDAADWLLLYLKANGGNAIVVDVKADAKREGIEGYSLRTAVTELKAIGLIQTLMLEKDCRSWGLTVSRSIPDGKLLAMASEAML